MINCPECGAELYPGTLFCEQCGAAVHPAAQAHVNAGRPSRVKAAARPAPPAPAAAAPRGAERPPEARQVVAPPRIEARLQGREEAIALGGEVIEIGRADPDDGHRPHLDLTPYDGQERGVSRRHATIRWVEGGYVITDEHSSNGTWLNGVRLVAGYAYQLPPGARLRLGALVVQLEIAV